MAGSSFCHIVPLPGHAFIDHPASVAPDFNGVRRTAMSSNAHAAAARHPIARISISDGTGIGLGQRLTQATASAIDGRFQIQ